MKINLTQRQIILAQFACTERANAMRESIGRMTNGSQEKAAETIREYETLIAFFGGLIFDQDGDDE